MSEKLQPCPFCGGAATAIATPCGEVVECNNCGASGPVHNAGPDMAAAGWNRRDGQDTLRAQLAAVEREREELRECLQRLYDEQNGPPLQRHEKRWQATMDAAESLLGINQGANP